jgi:hypothetical protein
LIVNTTNDERGAGMPNEHKTRAFTVTVTEIEPGLYEATAIEVADSSELGRLTAVGTCAIKREKTPSDAATLALQITMLS